MPKTFLSLEQLSPPQFNLQTASYTLVLTDKDKQVQMNRATANNLTIPPNSSVAFPIGTIISIVQFGVGQTTLVAGSGVTVRSASAVLTFANQNSYVSIVKIGTNEWSAIGGFSLTSIIVLSDVATILVDALNGRASIMRVTIAGNRTMGNPSNPADGQILQFEIKQDGTGLRTITWGADYSFGDAGVITLSSIINKTDFVNFKYVLSLAKWCYTGSVTGY